MKWISVKDRLPENDEYILAIVFGEVDMGGLEVISEDCFHWNGFKYSYIDKAVRFLSYWMPLSEPPKQEK